MSTWALNVILYSIVAIDAVVTAKFIYSFLSQVKEFVVDKYKYMKRRREVAEEIKKIHRCSWHKYFENPEAVENEIFSIIEEASYVKGKKVYDIKVVSREDLKTASIEWKYIVKKIEK